MSQRIVSPQSTLEDQNLETLRPKKLAEYVGQEQVKRNLEIFIQAAQGRGEPLDHILLYGPPGLGKTTLAYIIANEMKTNLKVTSGPAIEKAGDLVAILSNLENGDILFIDEIHRLNRAIEEILYPAMEDYKIDLIMGQGPSARSLEFKLNHFSLIGATTRVSLLSSPLRDRFGIIHHLNFYEEKEIEQIIKRSAKILNIPTEPPAVEILAKRSRRTPRVANRLLKRVRDFCQVKGNGQMNLDLCSQALNLMQVDQYGLDEIDRRILTVLIEKFQGGPVGISTIAAATGEEEATIEEIYEPFLMQKGFLLRTSRGRLAAPLAYEHLNLKMPLLMQKEQLL